MIILEKILNKLICCARSLWKIFSCQEICSISFRFDQRRRELAENFRKLGVTDDALADELEEIKHKMRAERGRQAS